MSMFFLRSSVIDTWLMSKSNGLGPGWMTELNDAVTQTTSDFAKPSFSATLYATAALVRWCGPASGTPRGLQSGHARAVCARSGRVLKWVSKWVLEWGPYGDAALCGRCRRRRRRSPVLRHRDGGEPAASPSGAHP